MAVAVSIYQIEPLLREAYTTITHLRTLDFNQLTIKDVITLVGMFYTGIKGIRMSWQLWKAFKQHGVSKILRPNLKAKYGEWAAVTGCTRGVGAAYVAELAACGLNLILISECSNKKLEDFATNIEKKFKVKTCIVPIHDVPFPKIYDTIARAIGDRQVGILMNNINIPNCALDPFLDITHENLSETILNNVMATTMMTHQLLPGMVEREKGAVIVVASSFNDAAGASELSIQGPIVSYLECFCSSLREEYGENGITVQVLKPYHIADGKKENVLYGASFLVPSNAQYAKAAVATLGWADSSTGYWGHTIQAWFRSSLPVFLRRSLTNWSMALLKEANNMSDDGS